jgi:hypothetical protein
MPHLRLRPLLTDGSKWNLLADYLKESIDNLRVQLETCDPKDLGNLQGQIMSLKSLLNLKDTLTAEGTR